MKFIKMLLFFLFMWAVFSMLIIFGPYVNALILLTGSVFGLSFSLGRIGVKLNGLVWLIKEYKELKALKRKIDEGG